MAEVKSSVNITIGAEVEQFKRAMEEAQKRASSFSTNLAKAAAFGATAFITLREGVLGTVQEFAAADAAAKRLDAALLTQGIYSKKLSNEYLTLAESLADLTGKAEGDIQAMYAAGQAMLGNVEISGQLNKAVADLAAGSGMELSEAFQKVTKTIGTKTNALAKNGFQIDENMTRQEKLAEVIRMIESRYGGQAEAAKNVGTTIERLGSQFGNLREDIGARFAPVVEKITTLLLQFVTFLRNSPWILDFASGIALAATSVLGLASGLVALKAAAAALAPVFVVLSGPVGVVVAAITALAGAAMLVYRNFDEIKISFRAFAAEFSNIGAAIGQVVSGLFLEKNYSKASEGLAALRSAINSAYQTTQADLKVHQDEKARIEDEANKSKNDKNKADRDREFAEENAHAERMKEILRNQTEAMLLQRELGSKAQIDLINQESAILKQIDEEAARTELEGQRQRLDALNLMLEENRGHQEVEAQERIARIQELATIEGEARRQALQRGFDAETELTLAQRNKILEGVKTESQIKREIYESDLRDQVNVHNRMLEERERFGAAFAKISAAINSREVQGTKEAAGELIALTQSKNATLKSIGKMAAKANIAIATAESAMNVYKGFSVLPPPFGQILGLAGAAAAVAFGAERIVEVSNAAEGGLVTGGIPGRDSVPIMAMPGELIVPKKLVPTFQDVIGSNGGGAMGEMVSELQALRSEIGSVRPNSVTINGDMLTDETFVDRLISKISDRLEFGNARLVGVNA